MQTLSYQTGHFVLESGLHADRWFDLDALFVDQSAIAPDIERLAASLATFAPTAVCGPLDGGAFLAQSIAALIGLPFLYSRRVERVPSQSPFGAIYELPSIQRLRAAGQRVALVDDMIGAGSATRATLASLREAGAFVVVVGALFLSGTLAQDHFAELAIPLVAIDRHPTGLWHPDECPLCMDGKAITTATR